MAKLFLSYSSPDREFVHRLATDLSDYGVKVWLDEWELRVGDDIRVKVEQGLTTNDYFAIVLSSASIQSRWVERELSAAFTSEITDRGITVLPLRLDNAPIPALIAGKKYADFSKDYDAGLTALLRVLATVEVRQHMQLEDRLLVSGRRGEHVQKGVKQRAIMISLAGEQWSFLAAVESVGNPRVAAVASVNIAAVLNEMLQKPQTIEPAMLNMYIRVCDAVTKIATAESASDTPIGTKMAIALHLYDSVFVATVGSCSALIVSRRDDQRVNVVRFQSHYQARFTLTAGSGFGAWSDAPLGLLDEPESFKIEPAQFRFRASGDFVAVNSFAMPRSDEMLQSTAEKVLGTSSWDERVSRLVSSHEPWHEDALSAILARTSAFERFEQPKSAG